MMMKKYPREAIMAVVTQVVEDGFEPIDDRVARSGLDGYIQVVAHSIGNEAADGVGNLTPELVETTAEVNFLHGVLFGLALAENEARLDNVMTTLRRDGSLKVKHYSTQDEAVADGLEFHHFEKIGGTRMARVQGHFSCETIDGNTAHCDDGWLAVDSEGRLYPIADLVARASYAIPTP